MEKYMIIDGERVSFTDEKNILAVIRKAGIILPTFCYYSDLSIYGACRMCVVEDKWGGIVASCSTPPKHEMEIYTNTPQLYYHRKRILELLLAAHCRDCTTCEKNGKCKLQELAKRFGIPGVRFENTNPIRPIDRSSKAIVKDPNKCILCGDCVRVCNEIQHVGAIDFANRGSKMIISTAFGRDLADTNCVNCGQCAAVCPTGAITIKNDTHDVWEAIHDPKKRVVMQIAPAVRAAWGERFGLKREDATVKRLVAALRRTGIDYVFDTNFTADLTIMEEANEFIERLKNKDKYKFPMFTSCCPGWVRFVKYEYPELLPNLSTAKSPQQMFGAIAKTYYAQQLGVEPEEIYCLSIMPCTAKKYESQMACMDVTGTGPDVDSVITTREVGRLIRAEHIQLEHLKEEEFDEPLGCGSGAAVIFGATGGVMEAALRSAYYFLTGENPAPDAFKVVRGQDGVREAEVEIAGTKVRAAVVSGLGNTRRLIERIKKGEAEYDFVEVMACPGGCAGGGGQPIHDNLELAKERGDVLYELDAENEIRFSHENPAVQELYRSFLEKPLSHKSHELLHTDHSLGI